MNFWNQRVNLNTASVVFASGAQLRNCHLECTWANAVPDTGLCPRDLCQLISHNISRSGEPTSQFGYMPRTASALQSGENAYPGARARINIWLTYGLWILSSYNLGSCRGSVWGGIFDLCIHSLGDFGLNLIVLKYQSGKKMHNYFFPILDIALNIRGAQ